MKEPEVWVGDVRGFVGDDEWIILVLDRASTGKGWHCLTLVDGQNPGFEGTADEQWDEHMCRAMPLIQRTMKEDGSPLESGMIEG